MGASKGKSRERVSHRNAAVLRRQAHARDVADHFLKRAIAEKEAFEAALANAPKKPTPQSASTAASHGPMLNICGGNFNKTRASTI